MLWRAARPELADLTRAFGLEHAHEALELLEKHPALAAATDQQGRTPLHLLCCGQCASWPEGEVVAVAERLLQAAPSSAAAFDADRKTPLRLLAASSPQPPVDLIAAVAAAWARCQPAGWADAAASTSEQQGERGESCLETDAAVRLDDWTPLHVLAASSDPRLAPLAAALVRADPAAAWERDGQGRTALHIAAANGSTALTSAVLKVTPDPACCRDGQRRTPLHVAATSGYTATFECLLRATPGPALLAPDAAGQLPLHAAAANTHSAIVDALLLAAPTAARVRDGQGRLPIHVAACQAHGEHTFRSLLAAEPSTACQPGGPGGELPLHLAAERVRNWSPMWRGVLRHVPGAARCRDACGNLPLHRAAAAGNEAAASALVEAWPAGAVVPNAAGLVPLDEALCAHAHALAGGGGTAELCCEWQWQYMAIEDVLRRAMPPLEAVRALAAAPDCVASRCLDDRAWQRTPGAQAALAAAWARLQQDSPAEAAAVARCLPPEARQRLELWWTGALCLCRAQREARVALPLDLVRRILEQAWEETQREGRQRAAKEQTRKLTLEEALLRWYPPAQRRRQRWRQRCAIM